MTDRNVTHETPDSVERGRGGKGHKAGCPVATGPTGTEPAPPLTEATEGEDPLQQTPRTQHLADELHGRLEQAVSDSRAREPEAAQTIGGAEV